MSSSSPARGLLVREVGDPEATLGWIRERRGRIGGRPAKLGELADVDLEQEFHEDIR